MQPDHLTSADLDAIAAEPYEHRGILHSEMALILNTCRRLRIETVIESGRARGQSTYMLAKYLPSAEIVSVEMRDSPDQAFGIARLAGLPNVRLVTGDGRTEVPRLAAEASPRRTAVLCDGPKGAAAVSVLVNCFAHPHVLAGFVHDMRRLDHGEPSPHRASAVSAFPGARFSDEPVLVSRSAWLDNKISQSAPCGPAHYKEFGSYGPTVGVFLNPSPNCIKTKSED